jgi:tripartite-type tricarboxylate transporter receptor subunit TctC
MDMAAPRFTRRSFIVAAACGSALLSVRAAHAQAEVSKLIIAFTPGGPVDFVGRVIAEPLGKLLGQTVVVDNKPGANGAIAAESVARATPDGRTLWLTSVGAVAINPSLYPKLPYDPEKDLVPVSLVVNNVEVLVVNPSAPYANAREFVEAAKVAKTPITMASSGTGSVPHLAMELLSDSAGIKLTHVPYKGAAQAITDVIAGHVDGFFGDIPGLIGHLASGKLKAIGIASPRRHPRLPAVPTFEELGIRGVDSDNWYGIFTTKGTPPAEVERVSRAVRTVLSQPGVRAKLELAGAVVADGTAQALSAVLKQDLVKWGTLVRAKQMKPD